MGGADQCQNKAKAVAVVPSDDDQGSSDDSDFIDERRLTHAAKRRKAIVEPAGSHTICSICMRPWHSSGDHRICCLRCGHLFGRNCIRRWIELRASCPDCQNRAKLADITVLFTSKFAVKDTSELQDLASKVEDERARRRRAESELLNVRQRYTRLQERFTQLRATLAQSEAPFIPIESVPLHNARILHQADGSLLVSCASDAHHGFRRFSLLDIHTHQRFHALHRSEIRDLHSNGDGLAASASLDKHLKITSLGTESCIADLDLKLPVWSCCFRDALTIIAGTANGQLLSYDLRRPSTAIAQTTIRTPRPIATLRMLDGGRLLCAGPGHAAIASLEADLSLASYTDLPIDEKRCIGAAVDVDSRSIVVTLRSEQRPQATHSVMDLDSLATVGEMSAHTVGVTLTRAVVFRHGGRRWVGSGDQETQTARLWDVSRPDQHIQLPSQPNGVVDMAYVKGTLVTLSSSALNLYKSREG